MVVSQKTWVLIHNCGSLMHKTQPGKKSGDNLLQLESGIPAIARFCVFPENSKYLHLKKIKILLVTDFLISKT